MFRPIEGTEFQCSDPLVQGAIFGKVAKLNSNQIGSQFSTNSSFFFGRSVLLSPNYFVSTLRPKCLKIAQKSLIHKITSLVFLVAKHARVKIHVLSKNSHIEVSIFHKIHISEISFVPKFTFLKYQNQGNSWIKSGFLPQCVPITNTFI